ncbi:Uncharacterised protein [Vibrio cholerae]|nr:Uncharacterised protein [Vibrio cholerae]
MWLHPLTSNVIIIYIFEMNSRSFAIRNWINHIKNSYLF